MLPHSKTLQDFFSSPARWVKGKAAADIWGNTTQPNAQEAIAGCLATAIQQVYGESVDKVNEIRALVLAEANRGLDDTLAFESVEDWNDAASRVFKHVWQLVKKLGI
jgi:hypothetical protein